MTTAADQEWIDAKIAGMTNAEYRRRRRQTIRGRLAFLIADTPAHEDRPLDELLRIADAILVEFSVRRREGMFR